MEENKNEVTLFSGVQNKVYCSKSATTEKEKKELFNALESCDALLNDCVGQEIEIQDIYVEEKEVVDDDNPFIQSKEKMQALESENSEKLKADERFSVTMLEIDEGE